ncbi:hypothetical protein NA56DRAFT_594243 [Hyaloscypha hepaticicola]|uniref:BTB domain-containing protein n=1 Tax=Hyaloscypha hepaticicola TaxID=2082293 RepID=A0A2J6QFM0_9HELO|nr:hypothetical protein NA56DRAFT_594243 [Hyaloscypha hepaticicola]
MARTRASGQPAERGETSLDAAMRAPSTTTPEVVVLDYVEEEAKEKEVADPKRDLYLSTVDGRYSSPIIPVRVGPHAETFPVHKDILTKSEYFRKALDGEFREAGDQAIDLPEENPDIFSFVIAYLYEEKFVPIKPMAMALIAEPDKGKGKEVDDENSVSDDGTDSGGSASDESTRSRRRALARRRRQERAWVQSQLKAPGRHRPDCACAACASEQISPPCWSCGAARRPMPPRRGFPPPGAGPVIIRNGYPHPHAPGPRNRERERERRRNSRNNVVVVEEPVIEERMSQEDLRTWSLAYTLSIDVYVCADRYLMQDFKRCISNFVINSFEVAGLDAGCPQVLKSCKTLQQGVSPMDPLLKKVFARVGFLQARMFKNYQEETQAFFAENPEMAFLIMKEMVERREEDSTADLPAMDRALPLFAPEEIFVHQGRPPRPRREPYY